MENKNYRVGDNVLVASQKSLKYKSDALFSFLKDRIYDAVSGYKLAYSLITKKTCGFQCINMKKYSLSKSSKIVSSLDKMKEDLIELKEYWEFEIKNMVYTENKEESELLKKQIKKFNKMLNYLLKDIKEIKRLFQRRIGKINHYLVKEYQVYEKVNKEYNI